MWQINDSRNKDIIVEGVYTIDIVHFDPEWWERHAFKITKIISGKLNLDAIEINRFYMTNNKEIAFKEGQKYRISIVLSEKRIKEILNDTSYLFFDSMIRSDEIVKIIAI